MRSSNGGELRERLYGAPEPLVKLGRCGRHRCRWRLQGRAALRIGHERDERVGETATDWTEELEELQVDDVVALVLVALWRGEI